MKKTLCWKSRITGAAGHGQPIDASAADAWVKLLVKYPDLDHWTETS